MRPFILRPFLAVCIAAVGLAPAPLTAQFDSLEKARKQFSRFQKRNKQQPAKAPTASVPLEGAFGLRIGDRREPGRVVQVTSDYVGCQFTPTDPIDGLYTYFVALLPESNRIAAIIASSAYMNRAELDELAGRVSARFGPPTERSVKEDGQGQWIWTSGQRFAVLTRTARTVGLMIGDETMLEAGAAEVARWRARPPAALGGPEYLGGLTLDRLVGLRLGQVFHPPANAKFDEDGWYFAVEPREKLPHFVGFTVWVSARSHRVLKIFGIAPEMTEAQQQTLLGDLTSRLGPSFVRRFNDATLGYSWLDMYPAGSNRFLTLYWQSGQNWLVLDDITLTEKLRPEAAAGPEAAREAAASAQK